MSKWKGPRWPTVNRQRVLTAVVILTWLVLAVRLVHVQLVEAERFRTQARQQQTRVEPIPARPGDLVDRAGRLLATTVRVQSLYVDPSRIEDPEHVVQSLGAAITIDSSDLLDRISSDRSREFLWVKRRLSETETEAVRAVELPAGTWGLRQEFRRRYPQGSLAAHVIGLRDIDGVGRGGAEEAFDNRLRGRDGQRQLVRDARGYVLEVLEEVTRPPRHGATVMLTIDSVIQLIVERQLDALVREWSPRGACAVVLDPRTGELLALASRPTFDPNAPHAAEPAAWSNHAISSTFEPGSTIKPCLVAWAVDQGIVDASEEFDCAMGAYRMGGRTLHDHHPYGALSVTDILVKSSNIGMARIGERLSNDGLHSAVVDFGFGRKTGIELPGERAGMLRPLEQWTSYSTGSIPMGQELSCTPLQVITAHAVLANGGRWVIPHVLSSITGDSARLSHAAGDGVVNENTARWIVQGPLTQVVERGTGTAARVEGMSVFGKSGTAQKIDPATGHYAPDRHVCSFVCGAPAEDPALLVLVSVDEPVGESHFGGTVAGPAASVILRQSLSHLTAPTRTATASPDDRFDAGRGAME